MKIKNALTLIFSFIMIILSTTSTFALEKSRNIKKISHTDRQVLDEIREIFKSKITKEEKIKETTILVEQLDQEIKKEFYQVIATLIVFHHSPQIKKSQQNLEIALNTFVTNRANETMALIRGKWHKSWQQDDLQIRIAKNELFLNIEKEIKHNELVKEMKRSVNQTIQEIYLQDHKNGMHLANSILMGQAAIRIILETAVITGIVSFTTATMPFSLLTQAILVVGGYAAIGDLTAVLIPTLVIVNTTQPTRLNMIDENQIEKQGMSRETAEKILSVILDKNNTTATVIPAKIYKVVNEKIAIFLEALDRIERAGKKQ